MSPALSRRSCPSFTGSRPLLCVSGGSWAGFCFVLARDPVPERSPTSSWNRYLLLLLPVPRKPWALCPRAWEWEGCPTSHSGGGFHSREGPGEMGWVSCQPHSWQPAPLQHQEGILSAPALPCKHRPEIPGKSLQGVPHAPWCSLYSKTVPVAHT